MLKDFGGSAAKTYPALLGSGGFDLRRHFHSLCQIVIVGPLLPIMVGLYLLVQYTKMGKAMRAVSEDKDIAALMGVNVNRVIQTTFFIGSALAGIAGVMVGFCSIFRSGSTWVSSRVSSLHFSRIGWHRQRTWGGVGGISARLWRRCSASRCCPGLQGCGGFQYPDPDPDLHAQWVGGR